MLNLKSFWLVSLFTLVTLGCDSSTEHEVDKSIMELNSGDIREYVRERDNQCLLWNITGQGQRTDGFEVFVGEWLHVYKADSSIQFSKFGSFIKDGYLYNTRLDSTEDDNFKDKDPFLEARLFKMNPEIGDKWKISEWDTAYIEVTEIIPQLITPAKEFNNVYCFQSSLGRKYYLVKGFGLIGFTVSYDSEEEVFLNYIKINNEEYGILIPTGIPIVQSKLQKHSSKYDVLP